MKKRKLRVIRFCGKKYCFPDYYFFKDRIKNLDIKSYEKRVLLIKLHQLHWAARCRQDEKNYWLDTFFEVKVNALKHGVDIRKYYK